MIQENNFHDLRPIMPTADLCVASIHESSFDCTSKDESQGNYSLDISTYSIQTDDSLVSQDDYRDRAI